MKYKAIEGSELGHGCCFNATVVYKDANNKIKVMCECFSVEDAEEIANALNSYNKEIDNAAK